jgi:hypothetical protein
MIAGRAAAIGAIKQEMVVGVRRIAHGNEVSDHV